MKKIFTLLVAVGMITLAQAQHGSGKNSRDDRRNDQSTVDKDYHKGYDNDSRYGIMSPTRQRDLAIDRINREYDWKIQKVKGNFYKSRYQKKRQIRFLNEQRKKEIRRTYVEFSRESHRDGYSKRRY